MEKIFRPKAGGTQRIGGADQDHATAADKDFRKMQMQ
jgi:hypothetical protein